MPRNLSASKSNLERCLCSRRHPVVQPAAMQESSVSPGLSTIYRVSPVWRQEHLGSNSWQKLFYWNASLQIPRPHLSNKQVSCSLQCLSSRKVQSHAETQAISHLLEASHCLDCLQLNSPLSPASGPPYRLRFVGTASGQGMM